MLAHVDNRITYNGNGNATEFAYQFKILDRTDIKVLLTDADGKEKLLTKDYYVDVEKNVVRYPGYAVGAEVPESERPPVLPAGWKLTIYREVPVTQETDLPDQYPFNQVEDIGDKLTMIAQQLTDVTSRSLKISVSKSADIDATIPWENGKSFRISDDGAKIELTEDPARVLPLAQGVYAQAQAQAQSAYASAVAAAQSEDSAAASASEAGNSAQSASVSAASAAESAELTSGYKQEALTAKNAAATSATNAKASEANAKTSENNAEASKEAAQSAATTSSNYASASRSSANEAQTYKTNAQTYMNNAELYMNNAKNYSENVNVFIPSVSAAGVLSWTNKAGLPNPASVNIKGVKGDKGDTGAQGIQGVKGDKGATGAPGAAATIRIGNVVTGAPGTNVAVTNSGTSTNAILNFTIPRGTPGADGGVTVDEVLNATSLNPVANKTVYAALQEKVTAEEIANTYAKKSDVSALMSTKLGVTATAYAATRDGAGNNIAETYAKKTDISGMVKSVNGTAPDASGNVNVEKYTHPNSGVTAGTYRSVTVNAQGHVTGGSNPTLAIAYGGTGATTAYDARSNLGVDVDVLLADATLLWQNPKPTSNFNDDSMTLSQPYTNFKRLLFIASKAINGNTYVSAAFINVDILSANIELVRNNNWTYVTYMVGTSGFGVHGDVSMITTTELQYSTNSTLRPQFIYGYK